jgi:riboflavin synthase
MFTGIITDVGTVELIAKRGDTTIKVATAYDPASIAIGASIACSGPCLTVIAKGGREGDAWFSVEASAETLRRWAAGPSARGSIWNAR